MRFKSVKSQGFQIFAVSGTNTISFAIQASGTARKKLLGFAVERFDPKENERYFMPGFKVFKSVIPNPDENTRVSTFDHPIQSFSWDDFTAKPGYKYEYFFYPLRGTPKNLDRSADAISIKVEAEPLFSKLTHDVFFNRGVASSQAYTRKFQNKRPDELAPEKAKEALQWLSRDLDEALLQFIKQAKKKDTLLCCFYEFRYPLVAEELQAAIERGVEVKLIIDAKVNESTDENGKFHESFPREENLQTIEKTKIDMSHVILREARKSSIQHNKFMVLLKGIQKKPTEVWTGSTNISNGGIHGQTNVGHWVRDEQTARQYQAYWEVMSQDLGARDGDTKVDVLRKNKELRKAVEDLSAVPLTIEDVPVGITPIFSPRTGLEVLKMYVSMVDTAETSAHITLAFGVNKTLKEQLKDNPPASQIVFLLLEKKDAANPNSTEPFVPLNLANNVYEAWGSFLDQPIYQWAKETNARFLQLNNHVSYIHSKFLLRDPLSTDPIVVTGSANFSDNSTNENDENMIIIRGDQRVADIYFTEFNRIFNHYYFRSVVESTTKAGLAPSEDSLFLRETADEWLTKYQPGKLKQKRVDLYASMKGFR